MATNKINGKSYIGQTVRSLEQRKGEHIRDTFYESSLYFTRALKKYGLENFIWKTVHECTNIDALNKWEIYYIKYYNTFNNGYNLTLGGFGSVGYKHTEDTKKKISVANSGNKSSWYGKYHSEETKQKMSEAHAGRNNPMYGKCGKDSQWYGKSHTKESKLKMSETKKGKKASKETRQKMSDGHKGEKHYLYGKRLSEKTKRKMSEAKKVTHVGKNNPASIAVIINNKRFDLIKEAAEYLGVIPTTVSDRIKRQVPGYQYA